MSSLHDNKVIPFLFEDERLVRTIRIEDKYWFAAKDVCDILDIKNSRDAIEKLDEDEKGVALTDTLGGKQELTIVSEGGLYTLILRSRLATTAGTIQHRFRKWVTNEVLPSIRKTGSYESSQEIIPPSSIEHRVFPNWTFEEMRTKKGLVDMYRMTYGIMPAQWIASQLGFPVPPIEFVEIGRQYVLNLGGMR